MKIVLFGVIFWLIETAGFGWNAMPCCWQERVCDYVALLIIEAGAFLYFYKRGYKRGILDKT